MSDTSTRVSRYSSVIGNDAVRFDDRILVAPGLSKEVGRSMSAYTAFFAAGARADLPAPYAEVWVVISGALRVGAEGDAVTVRSGDFVHVPQQAPGTVEALEDTTMVCVSVPAH
ncbi:cupin [Verrucosispora sp. ts21]|uniref:cupin domain-containing protein n=1 Tax=Verrucosispora sp. ts21 TaxID=2069341 RepID=UPI000C88E8D2|nr:cupin domain-containing protein [Verrucosispora sp. ts21]PMR62381.1 cupin [Verrucosispora sp. ts21]